MLQGGETALFWVARGDGVDARDRIDVIKTLVEYGAAVDIRNKV